MKVKARLAAFAVLVCLATSMSGYSHGAALRISPIGIEMPATQRASSITVANAGTDSVNLQMRIFKWTQIDGRDVLEPTAELMVSPPAATVPAGASYTIRVARPSAGPLENELSYRLVIDELPKPVDRRTISQGISMALRASMPVFVVDKQAIAQLGWSIWRDAEGLHAEVVNHGKRHAKISELVMRSDSGAVLEFVDDPNGYVLAGSRKQLHISARSAQELETGQMVTLAGRNKGLAIGEKLHVESR